MCVCVVFVVCVVWTVPRSNPTVTLQRCFVSYPAAINPKPSPCKMKFALASLLLAASVDAKVYFKDSFNEPHTSRWTVSSDWKSKAEMGEWKTKVGKWYGDKNDKSLFTTENARFYGLSAKLDEPITNKGKDLVIQYIVKNEQEVSAEKNDMTTAVLDSIRQAQHTLLSFLRHILLSEAVASISPVFLVSIQPPSSSP